MKITIIGSGNMGSAIAHGLEENQSLSITVTDRSEEKLAAIATSNISTSTDNTTAVANADAIILAVKPQVIETLFDQISSHIKPDALIISIAAGVKIERIATGLNHDKIVRVMPNTPAKIRAGISGWYASPAVTNNQKHIVKLILESIGQEVEVQNEDQIDAVTAVSGSGPAYFFYFLENIVKGGTECGLPPEIATKLAIATAQGAAQLAEQDTDDLQTLREKVTSKGGTTAAALEHMQQTNTGNNITEAVKAAYNRAKEL